MDLEGLLRVSRQAFSNCPSGRTGWVVISRGNRRPADAARRRAHCRRYQRRLGERRRPGPGPARLFSRLGVAKIALPPLRERKDEIPALAALFLARFARECGRSGLRLADDLIAALLLYHWPGNIRQLANEIRRLAALASDATSSAPPTSPRRSSATGTRGPRCPPTRRARRSPSGSINRWPRRSTTSRKQFIEHALRSAGGRVAEAAELLGLSRKRLFLKRRRQGLVGGES